MAHEIDVKCNDVTVRVCADGNGVSFISGMTVSILPKDAVAYASDWPKSEGEGFIASGRDLFLAHRGTRVPLTKEEVVAIVALFKRANEDFWKIESKTR